MLAFTPQCQEALQNIIYCSLAKVEKLKKVITNFSMRAEEIKV